jgi:2,3-dihydroxybiphenyl 1,2-dioxygenase
MDLKLGYLAFEVKAPDAWEAFATRVLGLGVGERARDGFALRMDEHAARIFIEPGLADDLAAMGWEAPDDASLDALVERLLGAGHQVAPGTPEAASRRKVKRLVRLSDPGGIALELFVGPQVGEPFTSDLVRTGFVTGDRGMGHAVVSAETQAQSQQFYCELLGFRLSDKIVCDVFGYPVDIAFLHANRRHHSIAFGNQQKKRIHHFMLEVGGMDDVGLAYDRALREGVRIMQTLGKHPNDGMFSFYAKTPSGFQFELGWGGKEIDDSTWKPTTYDHISEWGHHPPQVITGQMPPAR